MNQKKLVVAMRPNSSLIKVAVTLLIAVSFALICTSSTAHAAGKKKVKYGQIEISTNPGGFPLRIDGQPQGDTSTTVRVIELQPGPHNIEILLPNGGRWVRDFDIERGRKVCVNLNYHPKKYTVAKSPCPYPVNISAPVSVNDGDLITFTSDVSYGGSSPLSYTWTVSPADARIVSGAGTATITVDSTGLGNQRVTATLLVDDGSGDPLCRQRAQAGTNIVKKELPPPECKVFDQFPSVAFDDDKARFDNLAIELQNSPDATAYIFIYAGRTSRRGQADMLGRRTMDYLTTQRGVDARRFVIIDGGYRDTDFIEIWICPPGARPPQPTPTVQPEDVQPAQERTRPRKPRRRGGE
jgi:PEGA domain-containing protein